MTFRYWTDFEGRTDDDTYPIPGQMGYGVATREKLWDLNALGQINRDPVTGRILVTEREPRSQRARLYIAETNGQSWRLDGLGDTVEAGAWSPDGITFVVSVTPAQTRPPSSYGVPMAAPEEIHYIIEPLKSEAVEIARSRAYTYPAWSPDGRHIALMISADQTSGSELAIIDVATGGQRTIHLDTSGLGYGVQWEELDRIRLGGNGILDVSTGDFLAHPDTATPSSTSPDGRYVIEKRPAISMPPECELPTSYRGQEIVAEDTLTGEMRLLLSCQLDTIAPVEWLDNDTAVISLYACCHGQSAAHAVLKLATGEVQHLTDGMEAASHVAVSGDGRILVSGNSLRLFTRDGVLVREIAAPQGAQITQVAWSEDGSTFAFIAGPPLTGPL